MRSFKTGLLAFTLALVVLLGFQAPATAEEYPLFDKFSVTLGGGWATLDTTVRLDSEILGIGTEINFESDLNLDANKIIPSLNLDWHIAKRHNVRGFYRTFDRNASEQIATDIQFGEIVIPIDQLVTLGFDQKNFGLAYAYYPVVEDKYALGVGAGFQWVDLAITLAAPGLELTEDAAIDAPLPFINLDFRYCFTPKVRWVSTFGFLQAKVGDYEGLQGIITSHIEHVTTKHFSFGGNVSWTKLDVDAEDKLFTGKATTQTATLGLFVRGRL